MTDDARAPRADDVRPLTAPGDARPDDADAVPVHHGDDDAAPIDAPAPTMRELCRSIGPRPADGAAGAPIPAAGPTDAPAPKIPACGPESAGNRGPGDDGAAKAAAARAADIAALEADPRLRAIRAKNAAKLEAARAKAIAMERASAGQDGQAASRRPHYTQDRAGRERPREPVYSGHNRSAS